MKPFLPFLPPVALLLFGLFLIVTAPASKSGGEAQSPGGNAARSADRPPAGSSEAPSAKSARKPANPSLERPARAFAPLLHGNPVLAKVIMKHTELINFVGEPAQVTLLNVGVPADSASEVAAVMKESVGELGRQLRERNKEIAPLKHGSKVTVHGLTASEHEAVVAALETKLQGWVAGDHASYLAGIFAKSTRRFTNRWDLEVTLPEQGAISFFGGPSLQTKAVVTDQEGNETRPQLLGYPLWFLKYEHQKAGF